MIILAGIGLGLLLGWAAGIWGSSNAIGGEIAVPLAEGIGAAAALGSWRRNKMREKAAIQNVVTEADAAPPLETQSS